MLGVDLRRNVTLIRLRAGKLVIHSTGPFSTEYTAHIRALGRPGWILGNLLRHDTFAKDGRAAFPEIPYLAPAGFSRSRQLPDRTHHSAPRRMGRRTARPQRSPAHARGAGHGIPPHCKSRTLIATELIFNFDHHQPLWTKVLLHPAIDGDRAPACRAPFKMQVKDREAFQESMATILAPDFDRVIIGHGDTIESNGKAMLRKALKNSGFDKQSPEGRPCRGGAEDWGVRLVRNSDPERTSAEANLCHPAKQGSTGAVERTSLSIRCIAGSDILETRASPSESEIAGRIPIIVSHYTHA